MVLDHLVDQGGTAMNDEKTKWRVHLRVTDERGQWTVTAGMDASNLIDAISNVLGIHGIAPKDVFLVKAEPWSMAEGRT